MTGLPVFFSRAGAAAAFADAVAHTIETAGRWGLLRHWDCAHANLPAGEACREPFIRLRRSSPDIRDGLRYGECWEGHRLLSWLPIIPASHRIEREQTPS